jgi:hypothetical protein
MVDRDHRDRRVHQRSPRPALALVCLVGCAHLGSSDLRLHKGRTSEIAAQQAVPLLSITRVERTTGDIRERATRLAAAFGHAPCTPSRVVAWASKVLEHSPTEPLVCRKGLVIRYRADLDILEADVTVDGREQGTIERQDALRIAEQLAHELQRRGLVAGDWCSAGSGRVVEGRSSRHAGEHRQLRTRSFSFRYTRCVEGIPLFDTLLDLCVDDHGRVTRVTIADVLVETTRIVHADRSSADAATLMQSQADEYARSLSPRMQARVKTARVGYRLPKDARSMQLAPMVRAEVAFRSDVVVSRWASVSLVDPVHETITLD